MPWTLHQGDCLDLMRAMPANSIEAVVTDPPYGLEFMGQEWDSFKSANTHAEARTRREADLRDASKGAYVRHAVNAYEAGHPYQVWCTSWSRELLRVMKPGAYLLAFGGTRTVHRLTCGIEDAGFIVRDKLCWLYGTGFPKNHNIAAEMPDWHGWGTALKPAHEDIILAQKPLDGTYAQNIAKWGCGAMNIEECRLFGKGGWKGDPSCGYGGQLDNREHPRPTDGRWPANVVLDEEAAAMLDKQSGVLNSGAVTRSPTAPAIAGRHGIYGQFRGKPDGAHFGPSKGGASRFFKITKGGDESWSNTANSVAMDSTQSRGFADSVLDLVVVAQLPEGQAANAPLARFMSAMGNAYEQRDGNGITQMRNTGRECVAELRRIITEMLNDTPVRYVVVHRLISTMGTIHTLSSIDGFAESVISDSMLMNAVLGGRDCVERFRYCAKASQSERGEGNDHPTVKPLALMRWLCRLVCPPNGTILDPFAGSGTTLLAAVREGFNAVGIEKDAHYCDIIRQRMGAELPLFGSQEADA